jgi:hypothetical protein
MSKLYATTKLCQKPITVDAEDSLNKHIQSQVLVYQLNKGFTRNINIFLQPLISLVLK